MKLLTKKAAKFSRTAWVLKFPKRLGLDLAYALTGNRELLANFFQGMVGSQADAKTHAKHPCLSLRQLRQNPGGGFPQIGMDCGIQRQNSIFIFNEITQMAVFFIANRGF